MRLAPYESANFTQEVTDAWNQLEPLYRQIHAYVRHKLAKRCARLSIVADRELYLESVWFQIRAASDPKNLEP